MGVLVLLGSHLWGAAGAAVGPAVPRVVASRAAYGRTRDGPRAAFRLR